MNIIIDKIAFYVREKTRRVKNNLTLRVSGNYGVHKASRQFLKFSFLWNIGLTIKNKNTKNVERFCWENSKFNRNKGNILWCHENQYEKSSTLRKLLCVGGVVGGGGTSNTTRKKLLNCLILPSSKLENVSILDSFIENVDTC